MDDFPFAKEMKESLSGRINLLTKNVSEATVQWNLVRSEFFRYENTSQVSISDKTFSKKIMLIIIALLFC